MPKFESLPGHFQRGIIREAKVEVLAHKLSKTFGPMYQSKEACNKLFNSLCEKYSQDLNKINELHKKDSQMLFLYPLTKDREAALKMEAQDRANSIDILQTYSKYKSNQR